MFPPVVHCHLRPAGSFHLLPAAFVAIYHASVKVISRARGRSATAAAAYRAAEVLRDSRTREVHDYSAKRGVVYTEIVGWKGTRSNLWNAAEGAEVRSNARVARELVIALPKELNAVRRAELARAMAVRLNKRYGVAVDIAVHDPNTSGDERNHHAHLLFTTRRVGEDGNFGSKTRVLDDFTRGPREVEWIREQWEKLANRALQKEGQAARIDRRRLEAQGIDRDPDQHLGPTATQMERRGIGSDRGDENRRRRAEAMDRQSAREQLAVLEAQETKERAILESLQRERSAREEQLAREIHSAGTDERVDPEVVGERPVGELDTTAGVTEQETAQVARGPTREEQAAAYEHVNRELMQQLEILRERKDERDRARFVTPAAVKYAYERWWSEFDSIYEDPVGARDAFAARPRLRDLREGPEVYGTLRKRPTRQPVIPGIARITRTRITDAESRTAAAAAADGYAHVADLVRREREQRPRREQVEQEIAQAERRAAELRTVIAPLRDAYFEVRTIERRTRELERNRDRGFSL